MNNTQNVKIDWSKAPEGAEWYCDGGWYRRTSSNWQVYTHDGWVVTPYLSPENFSWWWQAVPKPTVIWDGNSTPPVGTVCEVLRFGEWVECEIVAHLPVDNRVDVVFTFTHRNGMQDWSYEGSHDLRYIRPIKSLEQIAAEEREKMIEEISDDLGIGQYTAAKMYDKGYRKPEQTE